MSCEYSYYDPNTYTMIPASLLQYLYRGSVSALGVVLVLSFFYKCMNNMNALNAIFVECGMISLGLYVIHVTIKERIHDCITFFAPDLNLHVLIITEFCIVLILSYFIAKLLLKSKLTSRYMLGKL